MKVFESSAVVNSDVRRGGQRMPMSALLIALLVGLPGTAFAVDIQYDISGSARHSDNIALADSNPSSDTVLSPRISFNAEQAGSTLQLSARGDVEYLYYTDNTLEDKFRGELVGNLDWTMLPERIHFIVENYLSRELVSSLDSPTSDNEQLVNILVAGPSFHARFNQATEAQLDLRYNASRAEKTKNFNSERYGVAGRVLREISANHLLSANAEASRVDFATAQPAFDYNRYDGYLGYERNLAAIDITVDLGYSWLKPRSGGARVSEPLARANLNWRVTPRSVITAVADFQVSDATQNLIARGGRLEGSDIGDLININPDVILTPDLFRHRRLDLGYTFTRERLTLAVRTYFEWLRYVNDARPDETSKGAVFDIDYRFRPRWSLAFLLGREDREFDSILRDDADLFLNIAIANQMTRHWAWRLELIRRQRDSTESGRDYDENAAAIALIYRR